MVIWIFFENCKISTVINVWSQQTNFEFFIHRKYQLPTISDLLSETTLETQIVLKNKYT